MLMTNNPPQLHNASQDQNMDFIAGNPFQLQNRFQKLHAGSTYGYENGFQTQNNANTNNGKHCFQGNDDIDPSTGNLNIYFGANRFPDYNNINELQSDDHTLYANHVNRNLHQSSQGNVSSKTNPPAVRFRINLRDYNYV